MIFTGKEIKDLAELVGLEVTDKFDPDILETEIDVLYNSKKKKYAYFSEYPEEGSIMLGDE